MVAFSSTYNYGIHINNLKDHESVNYRLFLLHGRISLNNEFDSKIIGNIICTSNDTSVTWPVSKGNFKCLAQLNPGLNKVSLAYENAYKEIFITFEPHKTDRYVVPVYFVPCDDEGCFQAPKDVDNSIDSALNRIGFSMLMIQCLFAEKLHERSYSRKSFQLEIDLFPQSPGCRLFKSFLTTDQIMEMNEEELWEAVARELMMSSLGSEKKKFVCFISCSSWNGDRMVADPALGGGGLALLGSSTLHTWPISLPTSVFSLTNEEKLETHLLDKSCYRGTYSGAFATSLGSTAHEIGHIFNLGHTRSGLMSRGFDNAHLVFIQALYEKDREGDELVPCLSVNFEEGESEQLPVNNLLSVQRIRQEESHLTFLEPGCAAILAHHLWFNPSSTVLAPIRYDRLRHIVESEGASLKVVQVRGEQGAVRRSWELRGSGRQLVVPSGHHGATLLAVNSAGTILVEVL